jgi:hypothetical protein
MPGLCIKDLAEGPANLKKSNNKLEFFRILDKHLVLLAKFDQYL